VESDSRLEHTPGESDSGRRILTGSLFQFELEKNLEGEQGPAVVQMNKKNRGRKSRVSVPLSLMLELKARTWSWSKELSLELQLEEGDRSCTGSWIGGTGATIGASTRCKSRSFWGT